MKNKILLGLAVIGFLFTNNVYALDNNKFYSYNDSKISGE